jgi:hypothetical protein
MVAPLRQVRNRAVQNKGQERPVTAVLPLPAMSVAVGCVG